MKRAFEILALVFAIGVLIAFGWTREGAPPSTYSTFDTGPNGFEALYDVLRDERVPVSRFTDRLGMLPADTRVLVVTSTWFDGTNGYDAADRKRLAAFVQRGGTVIAFTDLNDAMHGLPAKTVRLDARAFRNLALEGRPANALRAYNLLAGRGPVAFDEHVHGYGTDRSMWSVLPPSVRTATVLVVIALLVALVGANTRWVPALAAEPPGDRDSSDYIASMARLLRRAGAPHVAYDRKDRP